MLSRTGLHKIYIYIAFHKIESNSEFKNAVRENRNQINPKCNNMNQLIWTLKIMKFIIPKTRAVFSEYFQLNWFT